MTDAVASHRAASEANDIERIRPHLRPWVAVTLLALRLGPKLARHPGVLVRALRRA